MIKCNAGKIGLLEKDILLVDIESERKVLPTDIYEFKDKAKEIANNQRLYTIVHYGAFSLPTPEARKICSEAKTKDDYINARAIVVNDMGQMIMAKQIIKSNRVSVRTEVFSDIPSARSWIDKIKSEKADLKAIK